MASHQTEQHKTVEEDRFHFIRSLIKGSWAIEIAIAVLLLLAFVISKIGSLW